MNASENSDLHEAVAIIGMAGRFPKAPNIETFWQNLINGQEAITFFADNELDDIVAPSLRSKKDYIKARGILEDADKFDATFFEISPREAEIMDPQQRVFLEVAWTALEHAGCVPDKYDGIIGVFAGSGENTYFVNHVLANPHITALVGEHQTSLLNAPDYFATRASYKLNLTGPSVSLYTGCSTSLVAVCHGFDSLMSYQCDIAIAGGSFVWCPQNRGYLYHPGGILSADGHCRPFDEKAQGTVFSSGAGAVVLKRLTDALADNDHLYAIIRGTGLNNDGSDKVSFTAPSVSGQAAVIAMAQATAEVAPESVSYIETHGTGTPIGDPIEVEALTQVFRANTDKKGFCAIGSVKSNVGHLDAAAGIAGLIKTALSLQHKKIPPTIHFESPNPALNLDSSPFYVNNRLIEWQADGHPRFAGVSSFGVGGTNAHIVLEEAPESFNSPPNRLWQLLLISAKTPGVLEASTRNLVQFIKDNPDANLADMAYTLKTGRKDFQYRRMAVCSTPADIISQLENPNPGLTGKRPIEFANDKVVFMFPGQGAQYVNMGIELYKSEKTFQQIVDQAADLLQPSLGVDFRKVLYSGEDVGADADSRLKQTRYTQPVLFTFEYALAKLWIEWGIEPAAMIGHSIGEFVAACLSGVFSFEDALTLIAERGRLIQQCPIGAMIAVFLSEEEITPYLGPRLSIGAINAPSICVVSGEVEDIKTLQNRLSKEEIHYRMLETSHAFHSDMIDQILDKFSTKVSQLKRNAPKIPYISNVTGTWINPEEAQQPEYWCKHLRQTVRFSDGIDRLLQQGYIIFLEVGPGHTANMLVRQNPSFTSEHIALSSNRHPKEKKSDLRCLLEALGKLWIAGLRPDWNAFYKNEGRRRVPLPTYPFERNRYWLEAGNTAKESAVSPPASSEISHDFVASDISADAHSSATIDHIQKAPEEVEQILSALWQNILGIHEVSPDASFFDLGGSSLLAVSMFIRIEEIFGKTYPIATLYKAPTIGKLAQLLLSDEMTDQWRSLVPIQPEGKNPPLYLVHGAGGNVLIYRELANRLAPDQPVYGLQAKGLNGKESGYSTIEDMASCYLGEVLEMQPDGPFLLGGYCMGGTVALEMAQQLLALGKEVSNLILFETYNFSNIPPQSSVDKALYYYQKIDFHWRNFLLLDTNDKKRFFNEKMKVARARKEVWAGLLTSKLGRRIDTENHNNAKALYELWETNDRAADNYVPQPYHGRITHFMPLREYRHHLGPDLMWDRLAMGELKKVVLPVYPAGMIVEPFAQLLAKELKMCIKESLA